VDLTYSPEHRALRAEVKAFLRAHRHLAPKPFGLNRPPADARAWECLLIEHGYAARTIPREYGGYGAEPDILAARIIAEEFADAGLPPSLSNQGITMLTPTLLEFGTEEQKRRWIAPTLRGEVVWCQGYSEPEAGSDLASLRTAAVEDGDDFVVNGQKIWTSTAHDADMIFCLVRTEPDAPKHLGISYLLFSMRTPGIEVRPLRTMTGEAEFNEVFFTDVRVPKTQIVGARGEGWSVANATLKHERGAFTNPNAFLGRLNRLIKVMREETVDGRRVLDDPVLRDRLMELQARVFALQFNGLRLLTASVKNQNPGVAGLIGKLLGCEVNHQMAALAIDALGELGVLFGDGPHVRSRGSWQGRYMLDLGFIIGGGTAQIQKNIIAERGLGLPREPKLAKS